MCSRKQLDNSIQNGYASNSRSTLVGRSLGSQMKPKTNHKHANDPARVYPVPGHTREQGIPGLVCTRDAGTPGITQDPHRFARSLTCFVSEQLDKWVYKSREVKSVHEYTRAPSRPRTKVHLGSKTLGGPLATTRPPRPGLTRLRGIPRPGYIWIYPGPRLFAPQQVDKKRFNKSRKLRSADEYTRALVWEASTRLSHKRRRSLAGCCRPQTPALFWGGLSTRAGRSGR
jgi:hypothetical protein